MLPNDAAAERAGRTPRRARLSDGRQILYFDDADRPALGPPPPDERSLPATATAAELRHDPLFDEWVVVATHRQARTHLPAAHDCPLCPTRGTARSEIPAADYDVVVFENRFPSLPAGAGAAVPAGRAEVISYTSEHAGSLATLPDTRLDTVVAAWIHRTEALSAAPGVAYVFCFENRGEEIGVTLQHPHGQIYAYPYLPPRVERLLAVARRRDGCTACAELDRELAAGERVVEVSDDAVAYVPRAARWPYEIHVVPRRHVPDLGALDGAERRSIVRLHADMLGRLDRLFDRPVPSMAGWWQAPGGDDRGAWHLRLQLVSTQRAAGRLKYLAGSESLMGAFISDVRPEDAASHLRSA